MNTNLTKFEWTKTELKWAFYDQNNFNGNSVNTGKRKLIQTDENALLENENVNCEKRYGPRVHLEKSSGTL